MFLISQAKATEMLEQIHLHMATGLKVLAVRLTIVSVMKLTRLRIRGYPMCPHFLSYLVYKSHYKSNFSEMLTFNSEGQPLHHDTPM